MDWSEVVLRVTAEVRPYTMVPAENLETTMSLAIDAIERGLPGDIVETGTWMGGSSFAMLLAQRYRYGRIVKPVWMFDSFQGLPSVDARDGPLAQTYAANAFAAGNHDNCAAPIEHVRAAIRSFGFSDEEARVAPGWFNETVPKHIQELRSRQIAVLRVDCDWYEPVHYILGQLASLVVEEGPIILDDYYAWDGCALAVHDYLSGNRLNWRIRSMEKFYGAWMVKRAHRTSEL